MNKFDGNPIYVAGLLEGAKAMLYNVMSLDQNFVAIKPNGNHFDLRAVEMSDLEKLQDEIENAKIEKVNPNPGEHQDWPQDPELEGKD